MRKIIYLVCLTCAFGCTKNLQDVPKETTPDINGDVSINLANAFAYATNIDENKLKSGTSDTVVTNSAEIEENMIAYLSDLYGSEIEQLYYDNKENISPDLSNYENLADLSLDELNEDNTQEFVEKIFATTKTNLKSSSSYKSTSAVMQSNVDDLIDEIENGVQLFMVASIENGSFDELKLKNDLSTKINEYKENVNWQDLTNEEQERLLTAILTVENSIGNFISYSLSFPTENTDQLALGLKSTQGWLKNIVKTVAKIAVMTVCLVGGTLGGVALGSLVCGPPCMITGGVAGFVGGAYATSYINRWIDKW